jgi:hypothetical protein
MIRANDKSFEKTPPFGLNLDAWGRLVLIDAEGRRHVGVEPARCFPLSSPTQWVSICDEAGRELVLVQDLDNLPDSVRSVLEQALGEREFVPVITRVVHAMTDSEPSQWDVETDRGRTQFVLNSEDDVRRLSGHKALILDAQGVRYLIPDTRALDSASRRYLEAYL